MNLILITPHGRSGSLLVQSLLDSHTELISLPTLSLRYPKWELSKSKTKEFILEFIDKNPNIFDLSNRDNYLGNLNDNYKLLSEGVDPEKYQVSIKKFLENAEVIFKKEWDKFISRKNFFEGIHLTYAKTIGMDITKIKYMVIHLHRIDSGHKNALKDYPNLKFIATSRDPREHWIS